jgi:hypothetical protein
MMGSKSRNSGRDIRILAAACLAGGCAIAFPRVSHADLVLDVALAGTNAAAGVGVTTGAAGNGGINPWTYTPVQTTVPYVAGATWDAADTTDNGTIWNSIEGSSTAPTSTTTSTLFEQNLPLVDSLGNTTSAELDATVVENGKADFMHSNHISATEAPSPNNPNVATSTYDGGTLVGDGYTNSSSIQELMGTTWITNGKSEGFTFEVTGLTADEGDAFSLYVYGAGTAAGQGGSFTLASSNGGGPAVLTNGSASTDYANVFGTGANSTNPLPEQGLSWNLLTGTVDTNGDVTFTELQNPGGGSGVKPAMNGFQLDIVVPEPASVGLLAIGGLSLLSRRRRKA